MELPPGVPSFINHFRGIACLCLTRLIYLPSVMKDPHAVVIAADEGLNAIMEMYSKLISQFQKQYRLLPRAGV